MPLWEITEIESYCKTLGLDFSVFKERYDKWGGILLEETTLIQQWIIIYNKLEKMKIC